MLETSNTVQKSILSALDAGAKSPNLVIEREVSPSFSQTFNEFRHNNTDKTPVVSTNPTIDESKVAKNDGNGKTLPQAENTTNEKPILENAGNIIETGKHAKEVDSPDVLLNRTIIDEKLNTQVNTLSEQVVKALNTNNSGVSTKSAENILTLTNKENHLTSSHNDGLQDEQLKISDSSMVKAELLNKDIQADSTNTSPLLKQHTSELKVVKNANIITATELNNLELKANEKQIRVERGLVTTAGSKSESFIAVNIENLKNSTQQINIENNTSKLIETEQDKTIQNSTSLSAQRADIDIEHVADEDSLTNESIVNTGKGELESLMVSSTDSLTVQNNNQFNVENPEEELFIEEPIEPSLANFLSQLNYVPKVNANIKENISPSDEKLITQDNAMSKSNFVDVTASRTKVENNIIGNDQPDNLAKQNQTAQMSVIDQLNRPNSPKDFRQSLEQNKISELKVETSTKGAEVDLSSAIKATENAKSITSTENQTTNNQPRLLTDLTIKSPIQTKQWNRDFTNHVSMVAKNGGGIAKIKLNPEHLGPIEASVKIMHETVSVQIVAHHTLTRDAIDQNIQHLRNQLEQQGFTQVDVNVSDRRAFEQNERSHQKGNSLPQDEKVAEDDGMEQPIESVNQQTNGLLDTYV